MKPKSHNPESGFAVLMIYCMAAIVAIMLFTQIPRVAFEAQRDKEQLLIDRGEQYSRAIQLFVRKFGRYPQDFDALDNTQNLRFLRRKYKDPMTGKDDWRIIHVATGGVFTDSLIYNKKKDDKDKSDEPQNFITELQHTGGNPVDPSSQSVNVGIRQRQSDQPGAPGDPNNATQPPQFDANGNPIQNPTLPGQGALPGQTNTNGTPMAPGQPFPGQNTSNTGLQNQGYPNPGFQNQTTQNQGGPNYGVPNSPFGQPNQPGSASALINQLLTTPRPGGLDGTGGTTQPGSTPATTPPSLPGTAVGGAMGQAVGGGMAGVASKLEEDGIKVYKDQTSYNKWEFVYDLSKDPSRAAAAGVPASAQPSLNGQNPNGQSANPNSQNPNPTMGANTAGPFGQTSSPTPPAPPAATTPQ